ncbi:MAG: hypothetical protein EBR09_16070, partial [Proteobacteria bacterium]|nr:hypothetical protein [Pseudomonadota bacterium]
MDRPPTTAEPGAPTTLGAALRAPAPALSPATRAALEARFGAPLALELLPVLETRKLVARLCEAPRRELGEVVNKRALFVVLGCIDHALRARCCGSAAAARAAPAGGLAESAASGAELAARACEATPLHECLLRLLLEGNAHNRPAGGGLSREVYAFAKAEIQRCLPLLHGEHAVYPMAPGPAALAELSAFAEASGDMGVAPRFGHVYTARLRRAGESLLAIPPGVELKMHFLRRTDPARAQALA